MYRHFDDSGFSCFLSRCYAKHSTCYIEGRTAESDKEERRRRIHQRPDNNPSRRPPDHLDAADSAGERQIRSEHRFFQRSSNRFPTDQSEALLRPGRVNRSRIPLGRVAVSFPLASLPGGAYLGKPAQLHHSVVAFSSLFFTLLLVISSISTMTVQAAAADERRTVNDTLEHPPQGLGNDKGAHSRTPFRPLESGASSRSKVISSNAVRLKNLRSSSRFVHKPPASDLSGDTKRPRESKLPLNIHHSKFNRKHYTTSTRPTSSGNTAGEMRSELFNDDDLEGGDKLLNRLDDKQRFLRMLNASILSGAKSTSFISMENSSLHVSNASGSSSLIKSELAGSSDPPSAPGPLSESNKSPSQPSHDPIRHTEATTSDGYHDGNRNANTQADASNLGQPVNTSRSQRYRKSAEVQTEAPDKRSLGGDGPCESNGPGQHQGITSRHESNQTLNISQTGTTTTHWNIDDPDMTDKECFVAPFLPLHSDRQSRLEHSSAECLDDDDDDDTLQEEAESARFSSLFKGYNRRQRTEALEICQSFKQRLIDKSHHKIFPIKSFRFPFCSHLTIEDALSDDELECFARVFGQAAEKSKASGRGEGASSCLEKLFKFDQNARSIHCLFENAISYYNCEDAYSKSAGCNECQAAYKLWICSILIPHFVNGSRVPACPHYEQVVENRCPYLSPHPNNQYAGEAMFQSKNDRASINEVLMLREDVRPTCHYPCLSATDGEQPESRPQFPQAPTIGHDHFYDVNTRDSSDSSQEGVKRSHPRRMSVCLSHELDAAVDWSFDDTDGLLLELTRQRHGKT